MNIVSVLKRLSPVREVHAHCDIPCGIYDPIAAKIAAQTVQKMVMRIQALKQPTTDAEKAAYQNSLSRYIAVKEHHADLCKKEIDILWHDYFKPEHLTKYPSLHTDVWNTTKLASKTKQSVDLEAAKQLVASVDKIATMFWDSKGVKYSDPNEAVRFGS
ncbi:MAG: superoxide dismutase, Ni [SAR202 cluster bacterium]|nr:superoxide dismutase, Ni [SAR202 cluster bacterium]